MVRSPSRSTLVNKDGPVSPTLRNVLATTPPSLQVTPEVLVDIAGKIPAEVKEALWSAIKSGSYNKMVVSEKQRCTHETVDMVRRPLHAWCGSAMS